MLPVKFRPIFIFAVFFAVTSVVGSYWFFNSWREQRSVQNKPEEVAQERYKVFKYAVEKGDTWEMITKKLGIDWNLGASLLEASKNIHNFSTLREGNEFRFTREGEGNELVGIEYDIDDEKMVVLRKSSNPAILSGSSPGHLEKSEGSWGGGDSNLSTSDVDTVLSTSDVGTSKIGRFEAREEKIQYEIVSVVKQGVIESSLFETAIQQEIPASIILELARIFAWDVDFASSVQSDDSFKIVYEERFRDGEKVKPGKILAGKFINSGREVYAFYFEPPQQDSHLATSDFGTLGEYYNEEGRELRRQFLRSPLDYKRVTSGFSYSRFHPILQTFTNHRAIDYAAANGTSVSATADGIVNYAGWKGGNGKFVGIRHENGYETGYAHLSAYAKGVKVGVRVEQNQVIGFVGSTGWSTGPHLHYEMRKNGVLINPLRLDLPPGKMLQEEYGEEFLKYRDQLIAVLLSQSVNP